jgi:hypothetical protein
MTAVPAAAAEWVDECDLELEQYVQRPSRANAARLGAALWRAGHLDDQGGGGYTPAYVLAALITTYEPTLNERQLRRLHRLLDEL